MTQTLSRETTGENSEANAADYLARVREITPLIRTEAEAMERERKLTPAVAQAFEDKQLHMALVPTDLGGGGLSPSQGMHLYEEMAKADASTAWAYMASSWATAEVLGYLEPTVIEKLLAQPGGFIMAGQLLPRHPGVQVDGGYIINGYFSFASGSDHATWMGAGFFVADADGNPILGENGQPQARVAMMPKDQVDLKYNWDVWGLAGTGSHDYSISEKFVPAEYTIPTFGGTPTRSDIMYKLSNEFVGGSVTPEDLARGSQMLAWIHEVTDQVVAFAHRWGGSRSIGRTSELGRYVRDMHVATQHLLVDPKMMVDAAAVLLPIYAEAAKA
ncbi:acyl-CoA dehydrogenase family protein [Gordonia amicalis]